MSQTTLYLGINFSKLTDGKLKLSQPHLIDQIVSEVGMRNLVTFYKEILMVKVLTIVGSITDL